MLTVIVWLASWTTIFGGHVWPLIWSLTLTCLMGFVVAVVVVSVVVGFFVVVASPVVVDSSIVVDSGSVDVDTFEVVVGVGV